MDPTIDHKPVIIFDGECVLCNRMAVRVLNWDTNGTFLLASSGSESGRALLKRFDLLDESAGSIVVLIDGKPRLRSDAVLSIAEQLGRWPWLVWLGWWIPRVFRDAAYGIVAKVRYAAFGKTGECHLVPPELKSRLLP